MAEAMSERVRDGHEMVRLMSPSLVPGRFAFVTAASDAECARLLPHARGMFREAEGTSLIVEADDMSSDAFRQITLDVPSALDGVGLTAAVAAELAGQNIPCNVVAANHHDHVFVPEHLAEAALSALIRLSRDAAREEPEE